MKNYWISWYANGPFTLHSPWWISGYRCNRDDTEQATICAAVNAHSGTAAKLKVRLAHDKLNELEFRFCEERAEDWTPFCERFPKADWMRWPDA